MYRTHATTSHSYNNFFKLFGAAIIQKQLKLSEATINHTFLRGLIQFKSMSLNQYLMNFIFNIFNFKNANDFIFADKVKKC